MISQFSNVQIVVVHLEYILCHDRALFAKMRSTVLEDCVVYFEYSISLCHWCLVDRTRSSAQTRNVYIMAMMRWRARFLMSVFVGGICRYYAQSEIVFVCQQGHTNSRRNVYYIIEVVCVNNIIDTRNMNEADKESLSSSSPASSSSESVPLTVFARCWSCTNRSSTAHNTTTTPPHAPRYRSQPPQTNF